jgi:hypothetical protein
MIASSVVVVVGDHTLLWLDPELGSVLEEDQDQGLSHPLAHDLGHDQGLSHGIAHDISQDQALHQVLAPEETNYKI